MFAAVIEAALRGSLLLVMTWLVLKAFRLRDLAAEKNLWTLVAAASLAMPLLSRAVAALAPSFDVLPSNPSGLPALQGLQPELTTALLARWCSIVYLVGMMALIGRFATGLWIGVRMRRRSQRLSDLSADGLEVRVSAAIRAPASFASTILLPPAYEAWDHSTLAAVLAHEQAHIRNRDWYRLWLATVYRAVFWFNPLAHLLYRRLHMLSELTSDEAAAAAIGDRPAYADVLRRIASPAAHFAATLAMARRSTLNDRLKRLIEEPKPHMLLGRGQNAILVGTMFVVIALAAVLSGQATLLAAERAATLECFLVDQHGDAYAAQNTGKVPAGDKLYTDRDGRPVLVRRQAVVSDGELRQVRTVQTDYGPVVQVQLSKRGGASLLRITRQNIGSQMAVVYAERNSRHVISQATIRGAFGGEFQITGLNAEEAATLASQLDQARPR